MVDFFQSNWKDILEIIVSLIVGFIGGYSVRNLKQKNISNINGNNNFVSQGGSNLYDKDK